MKGFTVVILAAVAVCASAYPQGGYGSSGKKCKVINDVEYVEKLEEICDTKYR